MQVGFFYLVLEVFMYELSLIPTIIRNYNIIRIILRIHIITHTIIRNHIIISIQLL